MAALAANPAYVHAPIPPPDIYAHFVWFTGKVAAAAQKMASRLDVLPALWSGNSLDAAKTGAAVRELLGEGNGLAGDASRVAALARALLERISDGDADLEDARRELEAAATAVSNAARDYKAGGVQAIFAQSAARNTNHLLQMNTGAAEAAAARLTVAGAISQLAKGVEAMELAWSGTAKSFKAVLAGASDEQLGDIDYARKIFCLDDAARQWGNFAQTARNYVSGRLS
jgi:hypothetical protein